MAAPPAKSSEYVFEWGPSPASSPATTPPPAAAARATATGLSPPLIAMVAVLGTAFLIVLYARIVSRHLRRWRRRRRLLRSTASSNLGSPPPGGAASFDSSSDYFLSPYGLDDAAIRSLPLSLYSKTRAAHHRDCAVCLLEFEGGDAVRTLPLCAHAFHVACIDVWLCSHATCPLCRAVVFRVDSPFVPMRAARIRPSLDGDLILLPPPPPPEAAEIGPCSPPPPRRDFLLKRSYSFGFERSLAAERLVMDTATASPWRYRGGGHRGFWSKRWASPFSGSSAARVFSFRSGRVPAASGGGGGASAGKSPFYRRRGAGFFPLSSERMGVLPSRRSRSMASPSAMFARGMTAASSSRMRCGDPEALLSPERLPPPAVAGGVF